MRNLRNTAGFVLAGVVLVIVSACGGSAGDADQRAPTASPSGETFRVFGDYEIHFNALRTDQLQPEVARNYAIERSTSRVLLNVTMLRQQADGAPPRPVKGVVTVDAHNLNGQLKDLEMREETEGEAIYYIGEVTISGAEILVFDIHARPEGASETYEVKFKREFFAE
jgi:Domain of unknown function (DUF4426)